MKATSTQKAFGTLNLGSCPECEATSHIQASVVTRPKSMSGPCLAIGLICENGHRWVISLCDHSGGLWVDASILDYAPGSQLP